MSKIKAGSIVVNPTDLLQGATQDHIEDRSAYFRSDAQVTWTGSQLQFTEDIVLELVNTASGTVTTHTISAAQSPISLSNGESAYVAIDRSSAAESVTAVLSGTTPIPAQSSGNRNVFVLARRRDIDGLGYLHLPLHKQLLEPGQSVFLGASGAGGGGSGGINFLDEADRDAESPLFSWTLADDLITFTVTIASPAVFTATKVHGFQVGQRLVFTTTGSLPTGLTAGTTYYVSAVPTPTTFRVSATLGGADVNTTGVQSGTHTGRPLTPVEAGSSAPAGLTFDRTNAAGEVIRGSWSYKLSKDAANRAGSGVSVDFTIDEGYYKNPKMMAVKFRYQTSSGFSLGAGTVSSPSDVTVWIYDTVNEAIIPVVPSTLDGSGEFVGLFQPAYNSGAYRLILWVSTTSATAWDLWFDDVEVSPYLVTQGQAVYTVYDGPTLITAVTSNPAKGTTVEDHMLVQRVGRYAFVSVRYKQTVAGTTGTGTYLFGLPPGLAVDTSDVTVSTTGLSGMVGQGRIAAASSNLAAGFPAYVFAYDSTRLALAAQTNSGTTLLTTMAIVSSASAALNNDFVTYNFSAVIPIQGWGDTVRMSHEASARDVVCVAYRSGALNNTVNGSFQDIALNAVQDDTHGGFDTASNKYVVRVPGRYILSGAVGFSSMTSGTSTGGAITVNGTAVSRAIYKNGGSSGSVWNAVPAKSVYLNYGDEVRLQGLQNDSTSEAYEVDPSVTFLSIYRAAGTGAVVAGETIACKYTSSSTTIGTSNTIAIMPTKVYDTHGCYNSSTGIFTAPVPGLYMICGRVSSSDTKSSSNADRDVTMLAIVNGASGPTMGTFMYQQSSSSLGLRFNGQAEMWLNKGDTLALGLNRSADVGAHTLSGNSDTWVTIHKVG